MDELDCYAVAAGGLCIECTGLLTSVFLNELAGSIISLAGAIIFSVGFVSALLS